MNAKENALVRLGGMFVAVVNVLVRTGHIYAWAILYVEIIVWGLRRKGSKLGRSMRQKCPTAEKYKYPVEIRSAWQSAS